MLLKRLFAAFIALSAASPALAQDGPTTRAGSAGPESSAFELMLDGGAITSLRRRDDAFDTDYVRSGSELGSVFVRFRGDDGDGWQTLDTDEAVGETTVDGNLGRSSYSQGALDLAVAFNVGDDAVVWSIDLTNEGAVPLTIGDLALPLPMDGSFRAGRPATEAVLKHSFISGHGSFLFWMRPNSVGPYLTMTPTGDTSLEYWDRGNPADRSRRAFRAYVHSEAAGAEAASRGTDWRQPHTSLTLAAGERKTYGFKFTWADNYDDVRQTLVEEGLLDINVVPGMTVPTDLFAEFALRSSEAINGIEVEHPEQTTLETLEPNGDYHRYRVHFAKLGENRLKVNHGDGHHTYLEFFATEPVETLIEKRAAFIADKQFRDESLWYDGLLAEWANDKQERLGPDNYDRIGGWRIYEVTCDDPGLSKPAFLASKLAIHPDAEQIEALDYYIEHFVWGGLQMTDQEALPYAIYGIPDWKRNRESDDVGNDGRQHVWRIYDYPHIALMYYRMYQATRDNPQIETIHEPEVYLDRAYRTATAMFTIPTEIASWSAYQTGLYNELVIPGIIDELDAVGEPVKADVLRTHWERKVHFFVKDEPDLFGSEYPFDSTGFESTHALATYALAHASEAPTTREATDREASEHITPQQAEAFLELQMAANLFCRGWLETSYYYLGSDYRGSAGDAYTLSYMSQMGGWAVLDYALHHAKEPDPYTRLGYASFLSSWALMNSGTPESGYGYWYPGEANDGAAGGGFEPAPYGETWLDQPHTRGSWYYSCEIDLGFAGGLRGAATVLADDDIFGRFCYGGMLGEHEGRTTVIPLDGVRRRFHAMLDEGTMHLELQNDRFAAATPVTLAADLSEISFVLETDNSFAHDAVLHLSGDADAYVVEGPGSSQAVSVESGKATQIRLAVPAGAGTASFTLRRESAN